MATVKVSENVVVTKERDARVSDFSGTEIRGFHWSTVTAITCQCADGCGNKSTLFNLDLMPEEMDDFKKGITDLIASMRAKYSARKIS